MNTNSKKFTPIVTIVLIVINVLVFFAETIAGGSTSSIVALKFGALYTPYVIERGEWWRLFTSMFIHFGLSHIASNMLSLYVIGNTVEAYYGRVRFLILYLLSGLGGGLFTILLELNNTGFALTAGASGAIFGIMSAFVVFAVNPVTRRIFPIRRVIAGIFFALLPGFMNSGISISAHIGGFITGLIIAFITDPHRSKKIRDHI
ncbi:MAG: rhomboid family intramembrane serine protease [Candidatus Weimeria sp.]